MLSIKNIHTGKHYEASMSIGNQEVALHDIELNKDIITDKKDIRMNYEPCGIRV